MNVKSYKSSSTRRPAEWDKTSSPGLVFHNFNVVEVAATDENPLMYHYDVDEYELAEYVSYQDEKLGQLEKTNAALAEQNNMLTDCLLEMSEVVYA